MRALREGQALRDALALREELTLQVALHFERIIVREERAHLSTPKSSAV